MANARFYLKDLTSKEETLIYLFFSYKGRRLKYSTGKKIVPKYWNPKRERVKSSAGDSAEINGILNNTKSAVERINTQAEFNKVILSVEELREKLKGELMDQKQIQVPKDFFFYLDEFIEVHKGTRKNSTIKKYITLKNHLLNFKLKKKFKISFETIDLRFYEQFVSYLMNDLELVNGSIGKYIKILKTFLHWATEREFNTNLKFKKFKSFSDEADIIYLSWEELMKVYEFDFSKNKRLEQVRDNFCLECFTGLRFSDISQLKKVNIKDDDIHITTEKTKDSLIVPLNEFSKEILKKYDCKLPNISIQKTNNYLKEIGELVEINEPILKIRYRGAEKIQINEPKYYFISTHTARRSFVTLSLENGMRAETVMAITGIKDYKTLKRYIKITSKVKTIEMNLAWSRERKLKVV